MEADLHALLLLCVPAASVALCKVERLKKLSLTRVGLAILIPSLIWLLKPEVVHFCREGNPKTQMLIPLACLPVVLLLADTRRLVVGTVSIVLASFALNAHYLSLVHTNAYTGNEAGYPEIQENESLELQAMKATLRELDASAAHAASFPAGWLRESEILNLLPLSSRDAGRSRRVEVRRLWHTWFIGLYAKRWFERAIWYPGGPLKQGIEQIAFRDARRD